MTLTEALEQLLTSLTDNKKQIPVAKAGQLGGLSNASETSHDLFEIKPLSNLKNSIKL